jgi:hypothetical protein
MIFEGERVHILHTCSFERIPKKELYRREKIALKKPFCFKEGELVEDSGIFIGYSWT